MANRSNAATRQHERSPLLLNDQLCFAVYSAGLAMNKLYRRLLKDLDLTYSQYLVMLVLWEKDRVNISEVGERLLLDSGTLTGLLRRMESSGLLKRERAPEDERQVIISLTPKGRDLRKLAVSIPGTVDDATGCTSPELAAMKKELHTLRNRLMEKA